MPHLTRQTLERLLPIVGLVLFAGALYLMYRELHGFQYRDVVSYLQALPPLMVLLAFGLTVLNYTVLTGYDVLALRYVQMPLPYRRVALTSFMAYSFSIALGHPYLTGGAIRYRMYSSWGLTGTDVAKIILFAGSSFWVGYGVLGGTVFLSAPFAVPASLHLPFHLWVLGIVLLLLICVYFALSAFRTEPLQIRSWQLEVPSLKMTTSQAVLASADLALAALVFFVLLPQQADLSFVHVLSIYLVAVIAGALSQVPGGFGVFDTVILLLLAPPFGQADVLGALIVYRGIYYLLPLIAAAITLGLTEAFRYRKQVREKAGRFAGGASQWLPRLIPPVLAVLTFLSGAVLLLSGALPADPGRMEWLVDVLPLPLVEASHFAGSLVGAGLLFLAWGIWRRLDATYSLTCAALGLGIVASFMKGVDYEEAILLTVILTALLPCRRYFYRRSVLLAQPFSPGFLASVAAVLLTTVWLGLFAFKHVEYASELWWRFAFDADAPRFLRGLVGAAAVVLVVTLIRLLRPAPPEGALPTEADLLVAKTIIASYSGTEANLALLGDKRVLFNEAKDAFVMYAVEGRSFISMGTPVGPEAAQDNLAWDFRGLANRHGGHAVFYEVSQEKLPLYLDLGLALFKLGEEARVNLETFSLEGSSRKGLRHTLSKLQKEGATFEVLPVEAVPAVLTELRVLSDAWLAEKSTREKGFSLGTFDDAYLSHFPVAVIHQEGQIVAFANLWLSGTKEELSIDLMRYGGAAPGGVMELLFTHLMLWGQAQGYRYFSLGMAPFSGMDDRALAPLWNRLGAMLYRHGEHFYNFQGLRHYKEKFDPDWEPRYLAAPGGMALPGILKDLATLISGGLRGVLGK